LILNVLNFPAAPFGTEEFLTVQYGKAGHNYTLDDQGQPVTRATNELFPITLFPANPHSMYAPGFPDVVRHECAYGAAVAENVVLNAATGLFSETEVGKSQQLGRHLSQALGDVIQGRAKVSSWPDVVKGWRSKGGDDIRAEYEEAA